MSNTKNVFNIQDKVVFMINTRNTVHNKLNCVMNNIQFGATLKGRFENNEFELTNEQLRKKIFVKADLPDFKLDYRLYGKGEEKENKLSIIFQQHIFLKMFASQLNALMSEDFYIEAYAPYETIVKGEWLTLQLTGGHKEYNRYSEVLGNINFNPATLEYKLVINEFALRLLEQWKIGNARYERQNWINDLVNSKKQDYIIVFDTKYSVVWDFNLQWSEDTNDFEIRNRLVKLSNRSTGRDLVFSYDDNYKIWVVDKSSVNKNELGELKDFLVSNSKDFDYILSLEPKRDTFLISTKLS